MDQTAHTPGPWYVGPYYKHDVESREGQICECGPFSSPRAEANARLIAAAPALLEACKAIESHLTTTFPPYEEGHSPFDKVRAAIQKAEGGAAPRGR